MILGCLATLAVLVGVSLWRTRHARRLYREQERMDRWEE